MTAPLATGVLRARIPPADEPPDDGVVRVVLFSGGRGSSVLSRELIRHPRVQLTLAINGYDDGASTGEVRRFLGDSLGPSDFRKNASRLASELQSAASELIQILDERLPVGCSRTEGLAVLRRLSVQDPHAAAGKSTNLGDRFDRLETGDRAALGMVLRRFAEEVERSARPFDFSDCAIGNMAFAGCFLQSGRDFNSAVEAYCALLHLPPGMVLNVTTGAPACLVALDSEDRLITTEAAIVAGAPGRHIKDIFLLDRAPTDEEAAALAAAAIAETHRFLATHAISPAVNPVLLERIKSSDVIIYAPGTQHSSLFPSYLAPGLGEAIASNLSAIKVLITNLREDAEIADISAVELIERAVYYLKERNTRPIPTPCLITHYILNDPERGAEDRPYVPLGRLDTIEDPRLVRIGNYEAGTSGYHDATKIIAPFIEAALRRAEHSRIAVWLLDSQSLNTVTQTILEAYRAGLGELPFSISVFYHDRETLPPAFTRSLPFEVRNLHGDGLETGTPWAATLAGAAFDYVILFDSSGMYRGDDIVNLASFLTNRRFDAVWGSRRLSVTDIRESYKMRYRHNGLLGAVSYVGSHLLSLAYLARYGRYMSDTLSSARAVRSSILTLVGLDVNDPSFNQRLLSRLLAARAEVIETPVQFFPLDPAKARRTTVWGGLRSLVAALGAAPIPSYPGEGRRAGQPAGTTDTTGGTTG